MRKILFAALMLAALPALAADLYVTEFKVNNLVTYQVGLTPALANQKVTISSTSAQSAVFNDSAYMVRVMCSVECWVTFGTNPTATTSHIRLVANAVEYFAVRPGDKIAAITL